MDDQYQPPVICVFVSGVLSYTQAERDYLDKFTFPRLSELCASRGVVLKIVDPPLASAGPAPAQEDVLQLSLEELQRSHPVQQPPAVIDPKSNTWQARVTLGDAEHPWSNGRRWDIVAIAAPSESDMRRKLFEPTLKPLPTHILSTVVITVVATDR